MKTIGITGGVLQADLVGHKVMEPGERCYEPVVALFGKNVLKEDKTIDRRKVSDVVFSHEELLQELEHIIHPAVKEYILEQLSEKEKKGQSLCVVEAALLLEENYQAFCDQVWYIHTDKEIRMERLAMSRGYTREKAQSIIDSQASEEYFRSHADYIIENNGDLKRTYKQIIEGIERL